MDFRKLLQNAQLEILLKVWDSLPDNIELLKDDFNKQVGYKPNYMFENKELWQIKAFLTLITYSVKIGKKANIEDLFAALIIQSLIEKDKAFFIRVGQILEKFDKGGVDQYFTDLQKNIEG